MGCHIVEGVLPVNDLHCFWATSASKFTFRRTTFDATKFSQQVGLKLDMLDVRESQHALQNNCRSACYLATTGCGVGYPLQSGACEPHPCGATKYLVVLSIFLAQSTVFFLLKTQFYVSFFFCCNGRPCNFMLLICPTRHSTFRTPTRKYHLVNVWRDAEPTNCGLTKRRSRQTLCSMYYDKYY